MIAKLLSESGLSGFKDAQDWDAPSDNLIIPAILIQTLVRRKTSQSPCRGQRSVSGGQADFHDLRDKGSGFPLSQE